MNILVTGGTGGLGRAVVESLAADADNVVYFTYCRATARAVEIEACYSNTHAFRCDQTDNDELTRLTAAMKGWDLDVLVNNAWTGTPGGIRFHKLTAEMLRKDFDDNVLPLVAITQTAIDTFRRKHAGKIITVLTAALIGAPPIGYGIYGPAKAYVAQLAKTWSKEYAHVGVTSNCVSPDFMSTGFTAATDARVVEQMEREHPLHRLLTPADTASVVRSLAYAPQHLNGVNIPVDAGMRQS